MVTLVKQLLIHDNTGVAIASPQHESVL